MLTSKAITPRVKIDKKTFKIAVLLIYLFAKDLFRDTSLIVSVDRPRSVKTPNIPVIASARDRIPKPSTPKYLAVYRVVKNPNK